MRLIRVVIDRVKEFGAADGYGRELERKIMLSVVFVPAASLLTFIETTHRHVALKLTQVNRVTIAKTSPTEWRI